jgi:hypothetical protein
MKRNILYGALVKIRILTNNKLSVIDVKDGFITTVLNLRNIAKRKKYV